MVKGWTYGTCLPLTHSLQFPVLWVLVPSFKESRIELSRLMLWSFPDAITLLLPKVNNSMLMNLWRLQGPPPSFLILRPKLSPTPSSHQWLNTGWGSSRWWRCTVVPWWCSCRDTQNQSTVPKLQTQHSRAQTTHKIGPATKKMMIAGPATNMVTPPAKMYTPAPRVPATPKTTRPRVVR